MDVALRAVNGWGATAGVVAPSWPINVNVGGETVELNLRVLGNGFANPNFHWTTDLDLRNLLEVIQADRNEHDRATEEKSYECLSKTFEGYRKSPIQSVGPGCMSPDYVASLVRIKRTHPEHKDRN